MISRQTMARVSRYSRFSRAIIVQISLLLSGFSPILGRCTRRPRRHWSSIASAWWSYRIKPGERFCPCRFSWLLRVVSLPQARHRFPLPWSVEQQDSCFVVRDSNGKAVSHIYFKDEHGRGAVTTVFTRDEARHIAAAVAKMPELL
jgi:hypothetical protein